MLFILGFAHQILPCPLSPRILMFKDSPLPWNFGIPPVWVRKARPSVLDSLWFLCKGGLDLGLVWVRDDGREGKILSSGPGRPENLVLTSALKLLEGTRARNSRAGLGRSREADDDWSARSRRNQGLDVSLRESLRSDQNLDEGWKGGWSWSGRVAWFKGRRSKETPKLWQDHGWLLK